MAQDQEPGLLVAEGRWRAVRKHRHRYSGSTKEIGWFTVQRTGAHPLFDGLPDSFTPFHWHGETLDLPHEGKLLAKSEITETQAFAVGQRVLGLQFHMEATEDSVRALLKGAAHEIGHGVFEQQPTTILASIDQCESLHPLLDTVLDRLTGFPASCDRLAR